MGNFNARIGNFDSYGQGRQTKDPKVNERGKLLIDILAEQGLHILNGNHINDSEGQITFIHKNGKGGSVIDLALCTTDILDEISDFNVQNWTNSDHFPIVLKTLYKQESSEDAIINTVFQEKIKYSKVEQDISNYQKELDNVLINMDPSDINTADELTNAINNKAKDNNCKTKKRKRKRTYDPRWFDKDCREAKYRKKNMVRKMRRKKASYAEVAKARQDYDAVCIQKEEENKKAVESRLCNHRNSEEFWETIRSFTKRKYQSIPITMEKWKSYFSSTFDEDEVTIQPQRDIMSMFLQIV